MTAQARVANGVPTGGQFVANAHAETLVSLVSAQQSRPGLTPVQEAVREIDAQIRHLRSERDGANIQAAIECIRRDFPTAIELRVKNRISPDGRHLEGMEASSLRDAEGNDPAAGDPAWAYRGAETGFCLSDHLLSYENNHRPSGEAFTWNEDTEEWILPIRYYWKAEQP